jgi:signal transduction histidine kinase
LPDKPIVGLLQRHWYSTVGAAAALYWAVNLGYFYIWTNSVFLHLFGKIHLLWFYLNCVCIFLQLEKEFEAISWDNGILLAVVITI